MSNPIVITTLVGSVLKAALTLERDEDGRVERVTLLRVFPVYDRKRGELRRARRAARAQD